MGVEMEEVEFVDNFDFYRDMTVVEFLRDVGKNFRMNTMLSRDSVKARMDRESEADQGLSFTEFSY
jgi:tyrosyl-tRNA synthetase